MTEPYFDDPYVYYDAYDEMKPGDAGTEDDDWPSEPMDWRMGEPAGDERWGS